ncbi:MAG: hypothetical protein KF865_11760 [Bdellovibrionaceae bacterium]|nr:hypothetical protein [Pseudobdellovibrionaceae bacterium]
MIKIKQVLRWDAAKSSVRSFFLVKDGGKEVLRTTRALLCAAAVILVGVCVSLFFGGQDDTSYLGKTDKPLSADVGDQTPTTPPATGGKVGSLFRNSEARGTGETRKRPSGGGMKVNYQAKQVLVSEGAFDPARTIPMGTNLIGKTLTTIDTRQADQLVKVLLPYGGRFHAGGEIPKNSIVFGQVSYGGKGKKIFVKFSKGIFPSGEEFSLEAQALSSSDYSPGITGRFHGNADLRIASTLGLTMVAGMSDVLTEKESLGGSATQPGAVTAKANMKNALYHGVSEVAKSEAQRQAEAIGDEQEYVTVDAGSDMIVSLTKAYIEQ